MAVTSGFFNSLNGDRKYSAEQFSALFDNLITDGVFANVGTAFEVKATPENTVTIGIGRAWFNSVWLYNDTLYPMVPQAPEVLLNRIDAIVIEINHNEAVRSGQIRWVYGTPLSEPVRPTLTNTDEVHQYPLAYVYRHAGVSDVIQADITNMIGTSACPYVTGILSTQSIDKVVAQWESQFNVWFEGLETTLDGDVAANLANQVLDLQSRFHDLAKDRAVYEALQDSTGATIKDSDSGDILARTVLGGENVIINYPTGGDTVEDLSRFDKDLGNEYLWAKYGQAYKEHLSSNESTINGAWENVSYQYADRVEYDNGVIRLVNPKSAKIPYIGSSSGNWSTLKDHYITCPTAGIGSPVYCTDYSGTGSVVYINYKTISFELENNTLVEYLNSANPNAYPPSEDDGYVYIALGPLGGIGTPVHGYYTGNGRSTRSVDIGFQPKIVFVFENGLRAGVNYGDVFAYGGMAIAERDAHDSSVWGIRIESYGFDVFTDSRERTNETGTVYNYIAFK